MSRPISGSDAAGPEYLAEVVAAISVAADPEEGFDILAGKLRSWLCCRLVALQVETGAPKPLLLVSDDAPALPGIGVDRRWEESIRFAPFAEGEILVHNSLRQTHPFQEDSHLLRAGLRAALRGSLCTAGREIGRFGLFAEQPHHFTPGRVKILRDVMPALLWLCRQLAFSAHLRVDTALNALLDEVITDAPNGLQAALRTCRTQLSRLLPAAGIHAVLAIPSSRPTVLLDRAGIPVPGTPESDEPAAWRHWLNSLSPEGQFESVAWIFPIGQGTPPSGALAVAFPRSTGEPEVWQRRLRPMLNLLAMLAEAERTTRMSSLGARRQVGALAAGLADEFGNLVTELALQVDLLQSALQTLPDAHHRADGLARLVEKGTALSSRLERMANSQRHPESWEPLAAVLERTAQHLTTYQGGRHIRLRCRLGETGTSLVEAGSVEQAVTMHVLSLAQSRSAEVRVVLRAYPSSARPAHLVLWLDEEAAGGRTLILEVPVRPIPQSMEGSADGKPT